MFLKKVILRFLAVVLIVSKNGVLFLSSQGHLEHAPRRRAGVENRLDCRLIRYPRTYIIGNENTVRVISSKGVDLAHVA